MAGGNWSLTDKSVLPGFFANFIAAALAAVQSGERGVVLLPVRAHWGPIREFVEVSSEAAIAETFGSDSSGGATAATILRLALLGRPAKLLAYRIAASAAAKASLTLKDTTAGPVDVVKLSAKYPGERGNAFRVSIQVNPVDSSKKDLKFFENTTLLRTITFSTAGGSQGVADAINGDNANIWITAERLAAGNGTLADLSSTPLTGGNSGITGVVNADYIAALDAFETQQFNVLALDGITDSALNTSVVAWVKRVRSEGRDVQAVLGGTAADDTASDAVSKAIARSTTWNHEGIINVGDGGKLDGVSYSSAQTAAYIAGLVAGTALSSSTTYAPSPFEDVTRRWTRTEQELAVKNGVFLLIHDGRQVKALRGINSLITLRTGQSNGWKKIRTISIMDTINADLQRTAEDSYIGKVNNTEEGRLALIGACKEYLQTLARAGVIEATGYSVAIDTSIPAEADQVFMKWSIKPTDVMEQIFGTFLVR